MTQDTKPIPVIDDTMLVELFTKTGADMKMSDAKLAEEQSMLEAKLGAVVEKRNATSLSLRALDYVDDVHNGVALTVRPMVLDLVKFLSDPHSSFSRYTVPERYNPNKPADEGLLSRAFSRLEGKDKPTNKPLDEAKVIAIFPATVAMSVWVTNSMPMRHPDAKVKYPEHARKAIVMGFDSGWYVCPLAETGSVICGSAHEPPREFRHYKTRDGAMKAAYEYATTAQLTSRKTVPPELNEVYQKCEANEEEWQAWREKKRAEREASGESEPIFPRISMLGDKEDGEPDRLAVWHV